MPALRFLQFHCTHSGPWPLIRIEGLELIEDIGASSPEPELLISKIENYITALYDFMIKNFENSEFAKYQIQTDIT